MKETIQGTGSWGPEPPGPGTTYSNPRRERLRWPLPPKPRLKSGGGFGPDPGSGTTVPTRRLPAPRPSFDASASEEEEEEEEEDEEEVAAWRLPPRWGQLGPSQRPRALRPSHRKPCSQRRRRAMRAFQMLLYSKSTSLTFHWKLWGRHRGRRRNLTHPKNHLSPQEGGATPQVPSPCCRFDSPRGLPPPRLGLLGALMAEDGMRGSPPVPSGPPMEEDGLRWTPKSPLDPDSGKVGNGKGDEPGAPGVCCHGEPKKSRWKLPEYRLNFKGQSRNIPVILRFWRLRQETMNQGPTWAAKKDPILWELGTDFERD